MEYADEGVPLCVLAGKEYGSGSSRDWAAKGPRLLGIRFAIAESYERIHRSNLVGMGVLPLQFPDGESAESLGLTGFETFDLAPLEEGARDAEGHGDARGRGRPGRVRRPRADRHAERVALLPPRRDSALRVAPAARPRLTSPASSLPGLVFAVRPTAIPKGPNGCERERQRDKESPVENDRRRGSQLRSLPHRASVS